MYADDTVDDNQQYIGSWNHQTNMINHYKWILSNKVTIVNWNITIFNWQKPAIAPFSIANHPFRRGSPWSPHPRASKRCRQGSKKSKTCEATDSHGERWKLVYPRVERWICHGNSWGNWEKMVISWGHFSTKCHDDSSEDAGLIARNWWSTVAWGHGFTSFCWRFQVCNSSLNCCACDTYLDISSLSTCIERWKKVSRTKLDLLHEWSKFSWVQPLKKKRFVCVFRLDKPWHCRVWHPKIVMLITHFDTAVSSFVWHKHVSVDAAI